MLNKAKILKDAQKYVAKAQWDKAIIEYEKLIKESPNDANNHNIVGDLYLKRNDSENAIASYKKAAEIFNKSGFTLKAIALYKKVLGIKPDQVDVYLLLGKLNAERGLIGNANESYLAAAAYFSRQGQKGKAIDVYKVLCDLNPDNLSLAQKLADLYQSEGYDKEAVSKFIELAEKKIQADNLNEARELLDKAASRGSERFDFKRVLAIYDMRTGRIQEAALNLEEARKIDPSDNRILQLLAEAYLLNKNFSEAAGLLDSLLEKDPNNEELRKRLIEARQNSGDAAAAWKECSLLVQNSVSNGHLEEAESILKDFLSRNPGSIEALHCLADIQAKTGRDAEVDDLHFRIAGLYAQAGEAGKAENIYRKLVEKNPENEKARVALSSIGGAAGPAAAAGGPGEPLDLEQENVSESGQEVSELDLGGAPELSPETHGPSETPAYRLPDLPDLDLEELPPVSTEDSQEEHAEAATGAGAFEIPDVDFGDMESAMTEAAETILDEAPIQEDGKPEEFPNVLDFGDISLEPENENASAPAAPAAASREDRISEINIYIKYGMIDKAQDAVSALETEFPEDAAVKERRLEVFEALGDIEGYSKCSLALAEIYEREGRHEDAEEVLKRAAQADPENEELGTRLSPVSGEPPVPEEQEEVFEPEGRAPEDEMSFEGLMDEPAGVPAENMEHRFVQEEAGPVPGAEKDFSEEISEADFYLYQGLKDEARQIYTRILSLDPGNAEVKTKLDSLDGVHFEASENVYDLDNDLSQQAVPAPSFTAPAGPEDPYFHPHPALPPQGGGEKVGDIEDEFDAAFSEFTDGGIQDDDGRESGIKEQPEPELELEEEAGEPAEAAVNEFFDLAAELKDELSDDILMPEHPAEVFEDEFDAAFSEFTDGGIEGDSGRDSGVKEQPEPDFELEEEPGEPAEAAVNEFFDLAAELKDELSDDILMPEHPAEVFEDKQLEAVFKEFKKGVEEQLNKEDYETHYNLGIAYKEMGMLDEAVNEFVLASRDPLKSLNCASMLGLCFMEKGEYEKAVEQFKSALGIEGHQPEEYRGIRYDLATAYELMDDIASAQSVVNHIAKEDPSFRDIKDRLQRVNKTLIERGLAPGKEQETDEGPKPPPAKPPKKSKVSYL